MSITGMTLAQFADLMRGLGYKAVEGSREKVKPPKPDAAPVDAEVPDQVPDAEPAEPAEPEQEVFFTFTWGGNAAKRQQRPQGDKPRGKAKPKGKGPKGGGNKPQSFQAKPKREKQIDPDNPFAAALAGFKKD